MFPIYRVQCIEHASGFALVDHGGVLGDPHRITWASDYGLVPYPKLEMPLKHHANLIIQHGPSDGTTVQMQETGAKGAAQLIVYETSKR
ncbi:hypothetical protein D3C84_1032230 [compost metagenome]